MVVFGLPRCLPVFKGCLYFIIEIQCPNPTRKHTARLTSLRWVAQRVSRTATIRHRRSKGPARSDSPCLWRPSKSGSRPRYRNSINSSWLLCLEQSDRNVVNWDSSSCSPFQLSVMGVSVQHQIRAIASHLHHWGDVFLDRRNRWAKCLLLHGDEYLDGGVGCIYGAVWLKLSEHCKQWRARESIQH